MNVVIVNDYGYVNGGASKVAITTARALAQEGNQVRFFCGVGPVGPELDGIETVCQDSSPYNQSAGKRAVVDGLWDRGAERTLRTILSDLAPAETVVHVHSHRDALSPSVVVAVREKGFPTVYTCHEYGIACPYSSFYHHGIDGICPHRGLSAGCIGTHCNRGSYAKKMWTVARQLSQLKVARVPAKLGDLIYVSEFSKRVLQSYVPETTRTHVLSNPISIGRHPPRILSGDAPFVFVGLLTPGKDPVMLAKAAAELGVAAEFYGDGELRAEVMKANPQATVSGWLDHEALVRKLQGARAIVLPARWYETQGLVIQEAAALGVPAIVSRTCAATEFVEDGRNGLYSDAANQSSLVRSMTVLLDDAKACEMGRMAYEKFWSDPPSMEKHLQSLKKIYEGALAGG